MRRRIRAFRDASQSKAASPPTVPTAAAHWTSESLGTLLMPRFYRLILAFVKTEELVIGNFLSRFDAKLSIRPSCSV